MRQDKINSRKRERGGTATAEPKAKTGGGGQIMGGKRGCMGWRRWREKETFRKLEILEEEGLEGRGLTRVEKIMVLDWRRSEMVENSCL